MFQHGYFPIERFHGGTTHNSYIDLLLCIGWLGAGPFFAGLLYLLGSGLFSLLHPTAQTPNYRLSCALFAVVVVGMIGSISESWLLSVGSIHSFPYWLSTMLFLRMKTHFCDWRH
jgi:O-antigen ligase